MKETYPTMTDYEILKLAQEKFMTVKDEKLDEILGCVDGMETFEGAAVLAVAFLSIMATSAPNPKDAAIGVSAFTSVMIGFLMNQDNKELQ